MSDDEAPEQSPSPDGARLDRPEPSVGLSATRGMLWLTGQALLGKGVGLVGQIALTWLLDAATVGTVTSALAVAAFVGVLQQNGLRDILTQRQRSYGALEPFALGMTLAAGALNALLLLAIAPLAARVYGVPVLTPLIVLLAVRAVFDALSVIPQTLLQVQLRFRALGAVMAIGTAATCVLSVWFAWLGWGPYSLVVPLVIVSALQTAIFLVLAGFGARPAWPGKEFGELWSTVALMVGTSFTAVVVGYGSQSALGLMHDVTMVGTYTLAFNLSVQPSLLIVSNLSTVLFAALCRLSGTIQRQTEVAVSGIQVLSVLGIPFSILQAAVAGLVFPVMFPMSWQPAMPVFRILSIAMIFWPAGAVVRSLIRAQGRFRMFSIWSAGVSVLFVACVVVGAAIGDVVTVAVSVVVWHLVVVPAEVVLALGWTRRSWRAITRGFLVPLAISIASVGVGLAVDALTKNLVGHSLARAVVVTVVATAVYLPLVIWTCPEAVAELRSRVRQSLFGASG